MASPAQTFSPARVAHVLFQKGEPIIVWPQGVSANARTIRAVVRRATRDAQFSGAVTNDFNAMRISISARDNVEGLVSPTEQGREESRTGS